MFTERLTFNPRSKATNIGYFLLGELSLAVGAKSEIYVIEFEDSPEHCQFSKVHFPKYSANKIVLQHAVTKITNMVYGISMFRPFCQVTQN